MCDTFVAFGEATANGAVLLAKNADTEINEVQHLLRLPERRYSEGARVRTSHILIPQAQRVPEIMLDKSFWSWGGEIGFNQHGVAVGNEAVWSNQPPDRDGIMVIDMLRLILERAESCDQAVEAVADALERFGQGGNCELTGNGHFDGSFLVADRSGAVVIETAGRHWAARRVDGVGSISNVHQIRDDWDRSSLEGDPGDADFRARFSVVETSDGVAADERQATTHGYLRERRGAVTVRTMADLLRHTTGDDYHPTRDELPRNICMHAAPYPTRYWQATGSMVTECRDGAIMGWVTGTSGPDVSIFKPVFVGRELPDLGPMPRETYTEGALWWRHEFLHRRAMADYRAFVPEIRGEFEALEDEFFREGGDLVTAPGHVQDEFMAECWRRAFEMTERWVRKLEQRPYRIADPAYREMWTTFNRAASFPLE